MPSRISRRLVIDVSIARAAGSEGATSPLSKLCRDFLLAVRDICHKVVVTPDIQDEWRKHRSSFANTWRTSMVARRKLIVAEPPEYEEVWHRIEARAAAEKDREAMRKDFHLIQAAMSTDHVIVSRDQAARTLFDTAAEDVGELRSIAWVDIDDMDLFPWLEEGAEAERQRCLGNRLG